MYKHFIKRLIDIVLSFVGIVFLSWLFLILIVAIKIDSRGPVLFKQKRVGKKKNGEISYFNIWKFRTMRIDTPKDMTTHMLADSNQYITKVSKLKKQV